MEELDLKKETARRRVNELIARGFVRRHSTGICLADYAALASIFGEGESQ